MKRSSQFKVQQLKVITISWLIMGFLIAVYEHFSLYTNNSLGPTEQYSFLSILVRNLSGALAGALTGGSFLIFYVNIKYQDKPYGYTIFAVTVAFIVIIAFITIMYGIISVPIQTGYSISDPRAQAAFKKYLRDGTHIQAIMVWSFIVAITQLLLQVNSKFGQANFWNIIRGKYNRAKGEKKIFMFLDLNSSTQIAEQLGDKNYHAFLKDFFVDITHPIMNNKGGIYQYVGDEVVVEWNYEDGKENMNCLRCFFDMKQKILSKKKIYMERYGQVPSFKAGIHSGDVIAGEVGIIKRDITYSGNVLNATSRILSKCGELKEELIVSTELLLELSYPKGYLIRPLGEIKLKGKDKGMMLNGLSLV